LVTLSRPAAKSSNLKAVAAIATAEMFVRNAAKGKGFSLPTRRILRAFSACALPTAYAYPFPELYVIIWNQWRENALFTITSLCDQRRKDMNRLQFFSSVRVSRGSGHPVEEIENVAEALAFLREWPVGRRGPVYRCAFNCCSAAMATQMTAEEARKSFTGFARITGLLVDSGTPPLPVGREPKPGTLAH
jgi:hypothetical protein